jgi:phage regulatory protein, rha family
MKLLLNQEFNLYEKDGKTFCDSLQIANDFKKEHKNVLRDIESIDCSEQFNRLNFELINYKDSKGRTYPKYLLTKDGFIFLVMGYRGSKAARFKEAYIERFNKMEQYIFNLYQMRADHPALTDAIMQAHTEPRSYHFTNEINLINRIVLGMSAKQYREVNGLGSVKSIRPYLSEEELKMIGLLQTVDVGLLVSGMEYQERKRTLTQYYEKQRLLGIA